MSGNASSFAISPSGVLKNPTITRVTIAAANTEEPFAFPLNTKFFHVQNEGARNVRISYVVGETADGGDYFTLTPWDSRVVSGIGQNNVTIYLRSPGTETLSIEIWK